ncbi:F-box protein CPR30-like [Prunus yedoensis var. nudiflora]|uniref:F-box protein CPR30-like n=1 Tax=Prunus yedoensis var. nudiflora TaxID=2094558 RepID=A0A314UAZ7_PRUYE|nr:F-box protein CPR30-like [Prunus yedoensis var. nudiflora]
MDSTSSSKLTYIPEEIVREILLRLPAKSLIRCTAVCKSWSFLIKRCNFIDAHLSRKLSFQSNHQIVDGCQLLLLENHTKFNLLSCYGDILSLNPALPGGAAVTELMNPPILNENTGFAMVQTRNGLVCLTCTKDHKAGDDIFIWNPSIRRYVGLPRPNFIVNLKNYNIVHHFFGYDSHTNDYKVLRCVSDNFTLVAVEIYSLARGSWKTLTTSAPTYFGFDVAADWLFSYWAVVNDALHWVQLRERRGKNLVIVSFDISTELFGELMIPQDVSVRIIEYPNVDCHVWISKHKGSVALVECSTMFIASSQTQLHLWVMEEYGVVESWTKLYTYSRAQYSFFSLGFNVNREHVFMLDFRKTPPSPSLMNFYNWQNQRTDRGDIMDFFVESLVLLGHPNAISY